MRSVFLVIILLYSVVAIAADDVVGGDDNFTADNIEKYNFMRSDLYKYNLDDLSGGKSVIFTKEQIKRLNKVLSAMSAGDEIKHEEIFAGDKEKTPEVVKETVSNRSMKFYLNSILYTSKNEWIVWINGKRYDQNNFSSEEFSIEEITSKKIKLLWVTGYTKFISVLKKSVDSKSLPSSVTVSIVDNIANVSFYLEINQQFLLSEDVTISEGKL